MSVHVPKVRDWRGVAGELEGVLLVEVEDVLVLDFDRIGVGGLGPA